MRSSAHTQSQADINIKTSPTTEKAIYVLKFAIEQQAYINYDEYPTSKIVEKIDVIKKYLTKSLNMFEALYDAEKICDVNLELIKFYNATALGFYNNAQFRKTDILTKRQSIEYFKLAEKYYIKRNIFQIHLNMPLDQDFHFRRLTIYTNLAELEKSDEQKYKDAFVEYFDRHLDSEIFCGEIPHEYFEIYGLYTQKHSTQKQQSTKQVSFHTEVIADIKISFNISKPALRYQFIHNTSRDQNTFPEKQIANSNISLFHTTINTFLSKIQKFLNDKELRLASKIILEIANIYSNDYMMPMILANNFTYKAIILYLYESAAALNDVDALIKLRAFRNDNLDLWEVNKFRISPKLRTKIYEISKAISADKIALKSYLNEAFDAIDTAIINHAKEKIATNEPNSLHNYLRDFFENHVAEIEVLFPKDVDQALAQLLFKLSETFESNTIKLPNSRINNEIVNLFNESAIKLGNCDAISKQNERNSQRITPEF